jgi:hypothetical protein
MKICIVITGIICDYFLEDLINCYKNCEYAKIITTWNYIDSTIIEKLKENNFLIIQSDFPLNIHPNSVNYQNYSGKIGIDYAESIGFTHILKFRADMKCNDINKLLTIYKNIYKENKMIFLCHFHNVPEGYLVDYIHFGNINDTKKYICNFQNINDNRFPEKFRQEECYGTSDLNIINISVIYSGQNLLENNIDFVFLKRAYARNINVLKGLVNCNTNWGFSSF